MKLNRFYHRITIFSPEGRTKRRIIYEDGTIYVRSPRVCRIMIIHLTSSQSARAVNHLTLTEPLQQQVKENAIISGDFPD